MDTSGSPPLNMPDIVLDGQRLNLALSVEIPPGQTASELLPQVEDAFARSNATFDAFAKATCASMSRASQFFNLFRDRARTELEQMSVTNRQINEELIKTEEKLTKAQDLQEETDEKLETTSICRAP